MSIEAEQAKRIAEQWLDFKMNPGDPDCDACVLARQYLRAVERINSLLALLPPLADKISEATERQCFALSHGWRCIKRPDSYSPYRQCDECPLLGK
jgi:hypothetical protein